MCAVVMMPAAVALCMWHGAWGMGNDCESRVVRVFLTAHRQRSMTDFGCDVVLNNPVFVREDWSC